MFQHASYGPSMEERLWAKALTGAEVRAGFVQRVVKSQAFEKETRQL
jgi:hypothetical protein